VQEVIGIVVDYLRGPVMAAWDIIKGAFEVIKGIITGDFSAAWDGLKTMIGGVVSWIGETLLKLPIEIVKAAVKIGSAIVDGITEGVGNLAGFLWDKIKETPSALWGLITDGWTVIKEWGGKIAKWFASDMSSLASEIWSEIKGFPGKVWDKISDLKDTFVQWGKDLVGWVVSGIGSLGNAIGRALFGSIDSGGTGTVPPALRPRAKGASGGIVTQPTFALIGEAGPEAVIPLNQMPGAYPLRGGRGGSVITINVQAGLVSSPDQVGQQIIEAIQSAQRRSGPVFAAA
jgi:phage-related protein